MKQQGFTLIEVLVALAIFGVVAAIPLSMLSQNRYNQRSEDRTGAIAAAQQQLDFLRLQDMDDLPNSGSEYEEITVGGKVYDVNTQFCSDSTYCASANNRHLRVEVFYRGQSLYTVETVYTQLR